MCLLTSFRALRLCSGQAPRSGVETRSEAQSPEGKSGFRLNFLFIRSRISPLRPLGTSVEMTKAQIVITIDIRARKQVYYRNRSQKSGNTRLIFKPDCRIINEKQALPSIRILQRRCRSKKWYRCWLMIEYRPWCWSDRHRPLFQGLFVQDEFSTVVLGKVHVAKHRGGRDCQLEDFVRMVVQKPSQAHVGVVCHNLITI